MFNVALWILDKEIDMIRRGTSGWPSVQDSPGLYAAGFVAAAAQTAVIGQMPYYSMYRFQAAADWAVADIAYSRGVAARHGSQAAKYRTMTFWNYAPRTRTFAARGGWRFAATKVGSRFLGPVGVALLMYDAWHVGIWIGEKLFGEMD